MFGMEIDLPPQPKALSPTGRILQRLSQLGVPQEYVDQQQRGLLAFLKNKKIQSEELVNVILPTDEEAIEAVLEAEDETMKAIVCPTIEELLSESMVWLQWLMFDGDPRIALEHLSEMNVGQRGVCGAVWGNNDIAYRCRTCEHDPTCAICVPCFKNGNHNDHDYSIIYTGGGCCDCGDVTAWKREGFCSKHKGTEQIQPLPKQFADSMGPVLDSCLSYWKEKLIFVERMSRERPRSDKDHVLELQKIADVITSVMVDMLLEFCKYSESLLSFISGRVFSSAGLLDVLVKSERFLSINIPKKLHELLLKLLGEPQFKYEFAKVFLSYYPSVVSDAINDCNDNIFKKFPLLSTFSVQIFTVPTLTPRLVKEMNLLAMLLDCLGDIFISCAAEDGRLQVTKWGNLYETTLRVVEDIRFVMSHSVVPIYVTRDRRDISRTWMRLLAFVQGMNPQKRETGIHVEEENENIHLPFVLCHSIGNIHSLLVGGAFAVNGNEESEVEDVFNASTEEFEDQDSLRHAKIGRISESSVSSVTGRNLLDHSCKLGEEKLDNFPVPFSTLWLTHECVRAIESWLQIDNTSAPLHSVLSPKFSNNSGNNFSALKRTLSKFRRSKYNLRSYSTPLSSGKFSSSSEVHGKQCSSPVHCWGTLGSDSDSGQSYGQDVNLGSSDDSGMEGEYTNEIEAFRVLNLSDWPNVAFDVGSQDISVHIPLHRLLSMLLQRSLKKCYGESSVPSTMSATAGDPSSVIYHDFFGNILGGCHPFGFSAFVMEHPLQIRVFCAQVHAGMWRKNGDAAILSCEWYRSVRWSEQGLELDVFLLQCCAALAPADLCVKRILERFGLSNFLSLNLELSTEHEPVLVQEMLTLIIQIVKERRFCGLTTAECLQRELVYKLSMGDATRSQLVKSLPRDLSKFDKFQEILDTVAVYSHPSGMNQGMYKLRLAYWKELDLYHPRWNSRDSQLAEERYLRFCDTSALTAQLPKWSKIYHPLGGVARIATCKTALQIVRAVLFYAVFSDKSTSSRAPDGVLLTALHLLSLALDICCMQRESGDHPCYDGDVIPILEFASEEIYTIRHGDQTLLSLLVLLMRIHEKEKVNNLEVANFNLSSLIENLLKKLAELEPGCMRKLQKLAPELVNHLSHPVFSGDNYVGVTLDSDKHKAKARERQAAILEKMRAQQTKFLESVDSSVDHETDVSECGKDSCESVGHDSGDSSQVTCSLCHDINSKSPVSYLILLQKSRLLTLVERGPPSWEQVYSLKRGHVSASKQATDVSSGGNSGSGVAQVMTQSELLHTIQSAVEDFASNGQPTEVNAFLEFIGSHFPSVRKVLAPSISGDNIEKSSSSLEMVEEHMYTLIREVMTNKLLQKDLPDYVKNISRDVSTPERSSHIESLLFGKYIASVSKEKVDNPSPSDGHPRSNKPQPDKSMSLPAYDGFGPSDCDGIYLSSCGHAVHQGCLDRYLSSLKERYIRRIVFEGGHIVDPDQGEFLCPVCRGLANSILPALPGDGKNFSRLAPFPTIDVPEAACPSASANNGANVLCIKEALSLLESAADAAESNEILKSLPLQRIGRQRSNFESVFRVLCSLYFPGKDKISRSGRVSHSLILWDTLKYSLISTEIAARSEKTSLTPNYTVKALYDELAFSSGFILSLLLNIVQSMRTKNSLSVILRLRGIQLFVESICGSHFFDKIPGNNSQQEGRMECILENLESDVRYPDVQLWKRASDPVLARDAFSSLMWILFCLPCPFLSCKDSFLYLVHIFYIATISQAIITCCRKQRCHMPELEYKDSLISDVSKFMGEHGMLLQYFDSNHIDTDCDIKDAIRSLSFPYLRRCALLWRLINSFRPPPFSNDNHVHRATDVVDDMIESTNYNLELVEVEKLEKMFKIPSLDVVVNDGLARATVLRWLHHLSKKFQFQSQHFVLYSTPSVPFRLMFLPKLYQDLLQRYIKQCCPDCGAVQEEPILCLLCGKLCSPNWRTCCRESGCQTHAMSCGAGTGIFLLIKKTSILLQRSARQAPWPSPYLDAFGEEDNEMHRGKPLYLNEERYAALTHMVASHGLDRSSKVLRQTTIGSFFML